MVKHTNSSMFTMKHHRRFSFTNNYSMNIENVRNKPANTLQNEILYSQLPVCNNIQEGASRKSQTNLLNYE
jgi:hypothetical protein